jgi:putative SOS response-associated peptidase YedK
MCGRYMITTPPEAMRQMFDAVGLPNFPPRYNVAPTDDVPVVRTADGRRELVTMRWGLVPAGSHELPKGRPLINARSETVAVAAPFRDAYRSRRCLVPADGYYEWVKRVGGRWPFLFRPRDRRTIALAGLWESWRDPARGAAPPMISCTILTTAASDLARPIHDRMPVILGTDAWPVWLGEQEAAGGLAGLFAPTGDEDFDCVALSQRVNSVANDDAACIEPLPGEEREAKDEALGRLL